VITLEFVGAAQTVTGSKHLVRTQHATVLLDCGLVQGRRRESIDANKSLGFRAKDIDVCVLSHAHIDHSGALPLLVKNGFDGHIYATPATRDLCAVMLEDAAMIQRSDAEYVNRIIDREGAPMEKVEPLYEKEDVVQVLERMISVPYHRRMSIAPGVQATFFDAGHVLGSAITILDIEDEGTTKRLLFTGDLGRKRIPILRDPEVPTGAQLIVTESTYGDRLHKPIEEMDDELAAVCKRVFDRGGKIVVPSFALERAQEIVYGIKRLKTRGKFPNMPVYVDSPLTVKITDVFRLHPECYDAETRELIEEEHTSPFEFDSLRYVSEKEASKKIDADKEPCVIISASGMCEAGRVVHHLKATIEDEKNCVMIVGFQAPHTLGRRIVEKRPRVKIFGVDRDLAAEVVVLNGFSAHADQKDLVEFIVAARESGPSRVVLVHGEPAPQRALKEKLAKAGVDGAINPASGERITL